MALTRDKQEGQEFRRLKEGFYRVSVLKAQAHWLWKQREKERNPTMTFYDNVLTAPEGLIRRGINDRQSLQRRETEDFLRALSEELPRRREQLWQWDYSSVEAFLQSVEPNRQRWLAAVGDFGPPAAEMAPQREPFLEDEQIIAEWVTIRLFDRLHGRAVLARPKEHSEPLPLVLCQHGIS
ncbi:MAG TPA: hypothetical protein EYP85_05050, partial [Armatimonadetes bacterium]|nr:hypothetical protein [Armatimonadota bacterium]